MPLPLMVMPIGTAAPGAPAKAFVMLPPDEFDDSSPVAPLGPAPLPNGRAIESIPQRPVEAKVYPQNVADKPIPRLGKEPWMISDAWETRHNGQMKSPGREQAKVIFLGDSITDAWRMSPSYKEHFARYSPLNLGISGDYTQNLIWRIEHGTLDGLAPKAIVLMIGVNNLGGGFSADQTASGVRAVLASIRKKLPDVPVLVLSILPASEKPEAALRKKIIETNQLIAKMGGSGVVVHDIGQVLLEPDGTITKATLRDFLHPTESGYARLGDALDPLLAQIVEQS